MKKLIKKIKKALDKREWSVVYKTKDGRTEMYSISKPEHSHEFGNQKEGLATAGFRAFCYNRGAFRSFRYDRIVSLNRA